MKKQEKEIETTKKETSRRIFLKKAVYATPTVFALGTLVRPTKSNAFGTPYEGPTTSSFG